MYDVVIVGAGPAGLTAALYAGRSKLRVRFLEKHALGGQILFTDVIENFPGVYKMNAYAWIEIMKKQLDDLKDVEIKEEVKVEKVESQGDIFKTHIVSQVDHHKDILDSRSVIIATGAVPKRLGIKGEETFIGRGVSYCGTCDGPLFKNKDIVLIGGGDTALEEALYLKRFVKKLTLVHRRNALRAAAVLQERVKADTKIHLQLEAVPLEVIGKTRVEAIKIEHVATHVQNVIPCDGVFIFIGSSPDTEFLKGFLDMNEGGYIITAENMMSSFTGVFACGDCRVRPFKQVVTACSDGAIAAYSVAKFLENKI